MAAEEQYRSVAGLQEQQGGQPTIDPNKLVADLQAKLKVTPVSPVELKQKYDGENDKSKQTGGQEIEPWQYMWHGIAGQLVKAITEAIPSALVVNVPPIRNQQVPGAPGPSQQRADAPQLPNTEVHNVLIPGTPKKDRERSRSPRGNDGYVA